MCGPILSGCGKYRIRVRGTAIFQAKRARIDTPVFRVGTRIKQPESGLPEWQHGFESVGNDLGIRYGYGRLGIALYSLAVNAAFLDPCICLGPEPGLSASSPPEKKDQLLAPIKLRRREHFLGLVEYRSLDMKAIRNAPENFLGGK